MLIFIAMVTRPLVTGSCPLHFGLISYGLPTAALVPLLPSHLAFPKCAQLSYVTFMPLFLCAPGCLCLDCLSLKSIQWLLPHLPWEALPDFSGLGVRLLLCGNPLWIVYPST